ncbi:MAG: YdiU family protein [Campylobacterota bacterium]|nr:YdiU family protein [Campylobacterota bacterium]
MSIELDTSFLKSLNSKFYTTCSATPLSGVKLVSHNQKLIDELGVKLDEKELISLLNGTLKISSQTYASAYSGHQFGYFTPNLGDGRALNLGKINNYNLQLKGSGKTVYSRDGDGRAVLRSSIREYLISEAMHALGVQSSRAVAIITSNTPVFRESEEQGSIVLRASKSWMRFGSFEFAYLKSNKKESLINLADFVINESFSHLQNADNCYEKLYFEIVDKTLKMVVKWQSLGFMHGVMNTDNMSIDGLTIDYGPFAFMESFNRAKICNNSDYDGRYSFENQPFIAQWNLLVLSKMFSPIANQELLESYANSFIGKYKKSYFEVMSKKLGLVECFDEDISLIQHLLKALEQDEVDYTPFFYNLSLANYEPFNEYKNIQEWLKLYKKRLALQAITKEQRLSQMRKINPKYVLKNYMFQNAIQKAQDGDFLHVKELLQIAQDPYALHVEHEEYAKSSSKLQSITCSCSS